MSLLIAAIHERSAVIVSDGALGAIMPDGSRPRLRSDCRKFRVFHGPYVVGGTGSSQAFTERVYRGVEQHLSVTPHASFDGVSAFLARHLPEWYDEDVRRIEGEHPGAMARAGVEHGASVLLMGYDGAADRARLVVFGTAPDFAPAHDSYFVAFGIGVPDAQRIIGGWADDDWPTFPDLGAQLCDVIREVSRTEPDVGGTVYTCFIDGDTTTTAQSSVSPVAISALGGNQWRLTRPNWNSASGRVVFQATLAGRTTAYEGVTVAPQTSQATVKTLRLAYTMFLPAVVGGTGGLPTTYGSQSVFPIVASEVLTLNAAFPLPIGSTISAVRGRLKRTNGAGGASLLFYEIPDPTVGGASQVGSTQIHSTTGWATLTIGSLSLTVASDKLYSVVVVLSNVGTTNVDDNQLAWAEIDYTAPTLAVGL